MSFQCSLAAQPLGQGPRQYACPSSVARPAAAAPVCSRPPAACINANGAASRPARLTAAAAAARTAATGSTGDDALTQSDYSLFVRFLHMASPYVSGHRARTFVVVVPGEVVSRKERLYPLLEDILLLHGLGVKLVIVCGATAQIDTYLKAHGRERQIVGAYRVTDELAMQGAIEAAGTTCTLVSAFLSKAPSIPVVRRHSRSEGGNFHFAPAVQVVNGNYVTAKRRGIVNGIDFGSMGQVRFVQRSAVEQQLSAGNLVLLTNIGVSSSGELLNCNAFDVATHAAVELRADKLLLLTGEDVHQLDLPHYLPLDDAEAMITASVCAGDEACIIQSLDLLGHADSAVKASRHSSNGSRRSGSSSSDLEEPGSSSGGENGNGLAAWHDGRQQLEGSWQRHLDDGDEAGLEAGGGVAQAPQNGRQQLAQQQEQQQQQQQQGTPGSSSSTVAELNLDLDSWQQIGFPNAVLAAVVACKNGVKRAHLIDSDSDGALLLEMYTRDGTPGVCMIAADLYEGIRTAEGRDVGGLQQLLGMLAAEGFTLPFPVDDIPVRLNDMTVIEREGKVLGAAAITDLGAAADGVPVAELGAFVVHPAYRRAGFGDSLLDYVEQELRQKGFRRVAVVAGEGSYEWFAQRDFSRVGAASQTILLPEWRTAELAEAASLAPSLAQAQLYVKPIVELDDSVVAQPGKRIGF